MLTLDTDILFDSGSAELAPAVPGRLDSLLAGAAQGATVSVTGHTDSIGSDDANLDLSRRRADAVAAAVAGVRPDLALVVDGRGESEPAVPNEKNGEDDPAGREQNRRVEVRFGG